MKIKEKTKLKEEVGQFTIDPKLNDVAKRRKPSPKLEEANIILSRLKRIRKCGFFLIGQDY